ncbi:MAG: hypothetical protein IPK22_01325 [Verrucomicrobiaceae bacterium]|nr:hypothetical protein [Verrucomicrobiaceae bacterium]
MSNPSPDLSELHAALSLAQPALIALRYRSALVLDDILRSARQLIAPRSLHELRFEISPHRTEASAFQLVHQATQLASADIPVIAIRPEPGAATDSPDLPAFWKALNSQREALGRVPAIVIICLDEAHTATAYQHATDLLSWCAPKFEFNALTSLGSDHSGLALGEAASRSSGTGGRSTWDSLHPLWRQALASGKPLTADLTTRVVLPLLRAAVDNGMVSEGHAFMQEANAAHVPFRDEHQRSLWLDSCGDLAVVQGDLAGASRSYTESKTISESLAASNPANAVWQRDLSVSLEKLGDLAVAQGDLAEALRSFTESKTIREYLAVSDPANAGWQRDLSVSMDRLGNLAVAQGDLARALRSFTESKTIRERLAASDPANAGWQRDLSVSQIKLGDLAVAQGNLAGALHYFTESKTIREYLAARDPANAALQRDLYVSMVRLGHLAVEQGDLAGALRCITEGKNIVERLVASDSANAEWQRDLFYSNAMIATKVFPPQQRWEEALELMEQGLCISERLAATDPTNVIWQKDVQVSRNLVTKLRAKAGK